MAVQRQEFYSQGPKSGAVLSIWFPPPARHWSNAPWNLWIWGGLPNDWPNLFITFLIKLPSDNLISGKYCKFWVLTTWCKWFRGWLKFHACGGCVHDLGGQKILLNCHPGPFLSSFLPFLSLPVTNWSLGLPPPSLSVKNDRESPPKKLLSACTDSYR